MLFEQADQPVKEPHILYVYTITVDYVVDDRFANDILPIELDGDLIKFFIFFKLQVFSTLMARGIWLFL
jgi:hypothetical protein